MHTWLSNVTSAEPAGFLLDRIADAVVAIDDGRHIQYWNQAASTIYGWQAAEVLGQPISHVLEVVRYLDGSEPAEVVAQTMEQGAWRGTVVQRHRDGHELIIDASIHLLRDGTGRVIGMVGVNRDLTERYALEQAAQEAARRAEESRALVETLFRAAPIGFAFFDPELRFQLINERLAACNRQPIAAHIGQPIRAVVPAIADAMEPLVRRVLETGEPVVDVHLAGDSLGPPWEGKHWLETFYPVVTAAGEKLGVGVVSVEVTELKQLGLDLARSQLQLAGIISSALDAIITIDERQQIVLFNQAAEQLFGVTAAEALGTSIERFIPSSFRSNHQRYVDAFGRTGSPTGHRPSPERPLVAQRADGSTFPIDISISQLTIDDARLYTVILRDVSARAAAEQQLRASEANLRAVFDNTAQSFVLLDLDHTIVLWNRLADERGIAVTGKPLVVGASILEYTAPSIIPALQASLARAVRGEAVHVERSLGTPDCPLWLAFDYIPVRDPSGQVIGTCLTTLDITAQRIALDTITRSEERFRALVAEASDLLVLLGEDLTLRYASPAWERVLGRSIDDWTGQNPLGLLHPDDLPTALQALGTLLGGSAEQAQVTVRLQHVQGEWIWVEILGRDLRTHPAVLGIVLTIRDITERKRLTAQLLQAQKMESVGRLAGGVAHDFNNLLTAITGYTELALDSLPADALARADIAEVQKAAGRAAGLTRQLLAFARKQAIAPQACVVNNLIADMDRLLRRLIGEDVTLVTTLAPEVGVIMADPGQFEQVIVNMAVNARDAMPDGGTLTIQTASVIVDPAMTDRLPELCPGTYVRITISDTGVGIDERVREHLFEPFFTTKGPTRGTGLGLATCYGIVAQHGGAIDVVSTPGTGATFLIYIPQINAPVPSSVEPQTPPPLHGSETLLVVEDDVTVRGLATRVLREHGYTVLEANDGREALQLVAAEQRIHLVLSDVVMPNLGGRELVARLRERWPRLPIVCMSGYTDDTSIPTVFHDLHVPLLHKPFAPATLLQAVREALDLIRPVAEGCSDGAPRRGTGNNE